jgi:hypothetical protein
MVSEGRRLRRERDALATRLALSRGDIPAPVIELLLAGKRYRPSSATGKKLARA